MKSFERELSVWAKLNHPRILPFLGIVTDVGPCISLVSVHFIVDHIILSRWVGFPLAREWQHQEVHRPSIGQFTLLIVLT